MMMDYERGLAELRAYLQTQPDAFAEFAVLEQRLRTNLKDERLFGSSEVSRSERAYVVHGLNRLAMDAAGVSFNELCAGALASPSSVAAAEGSVAIGGDIIQVSGDADIIGPASSSTVISAGRDVIIHYQDLTTSLISLLSSLRQEVLIQAPAGEKIDALEQIDRLEQAFQAEHPDFGVLARVQEWFKKQVPELAGVLTSVLLHPAVREAVERQRELLETELELHRRNLHKLEERAALYGPAEAPLHILNQIDTERRRIQELEDLLNQIDEHVEN